MAPKKHSLTLQGHRTSVSLEDEFWAAFRQIARQKGRTINALASEIDVSRPPGTGLASAIRLFVLAHYRSPCDHPDADPDADRGANPGA